MTASESGRGPIDALLSSGPRVINVGVQEFAESIEAQGAPVIHMAWRPPTGISDELRDILDRVL